MNLTIFEFGMGITAITLLGVVVWLVIIGYKRENYTRERFAFVAIAAFGTMATSILSSLAHTETPWGAVLNLVRAGLKIPPQPDPLRVTDTILMFLVLVVTGWLFSDFFKKWDGAVSIRQYNKQRFHESESLVSDGLNEARRIIKREPPLEIYRRGPSNGFVSLLVTCNT